MDKGNNKKGIKRGLAAAALILIALVIIAMFINIAMGGDPGITLMFLFFLIVIPAVAYIFLAFCRTVSGKNNDADD